MPEFFIKRTWMAHKGGTKFYQVIQFRRQHAGGSDRHVAVHHWGPARSATEGPYTRPIVGGQVKVIPGDDGTAKIKEKKAGGYAPADNGPKSWGQNIAARDVEIFKKQVVTLIGAERAHLVFLEFGLIEGAETDPSPELETESIEPAQPLSEWAGVW